MALISALALLKTTAALLESTPAQQLLQEPWGPELPHIASLAVTVLELSKPPSTKPAAAGHAGVKASSANEDDSDLERAGKIVVHAAGALPGCLQEVLLDEASSTEGLLQRQEHRSLWQCTKPLFLTLFACIVSDLWYLRSGMSALRVPSNPAKRGKPIQPSSSDPAPTVSVLATHEKLLSRLGVSLPLKTAGLWFKSDDSLKEWQASLEGVPKWFDTLVVLAAKLPSYELAAEPLLHTAVLGVMVEVLLLWPIQEAGQVCRTCSTHLRIIFGAGLCGIMGHLTMIQYA